MNLKEKSGLSMVKVNLNATMDSLMVIIIYINNGTRL